MVKMQKLTLWMTAAAMLALVGVVQGSYITATGVWTTNAAGDWSTTDSLAGLPVDRTDRGVKATDIATGAETWYGWTWGTMAPTIPYYTDGLATHYCEGWVGVGNVWGGGEQRFVIDLGVTDAASRQLNSFTGWLSGYGDHGTGVNVNEKIQVSMDGSTWHDVGVMDNSYYNGGTKDYDYNKLSFSWNPDDVVGFRYVSVLDYTSADYAKHPRWIEWDADVSIVPEPATMILLSIGGGLFLRRKV